MRFINKFVERYVLPSLLDDINVEALGIWNEKMDNYIYYISDFGNEEYAALLDYRVRIMTSLSYNIGQLLLPICLAETAKMRELYKPPPDPDVPDSVKELYKVLKNAKTEIPNLSIPFFKAYAAAIETDPTRRAAIQALTFPTGPIKSIHPIYNTFTVIVLHSNHSKNGLFLDVPRIVTHGKQRETLWLDDEPHHFYNSDSMSVDETRVATDEEVEACVTSLSPTQCRRVMTMDLFAPIVNVLYEEQTELVAVKTVEPPGKEISSVLSDDIPFELTVEDFPIGSVVQIGTLGQDSIVGTVIEHNIDSLRVADTSNKVWNTLPRNCKLISKSSS